jgi:hypothetical protein
MAPKPKAHHYPGSGDVEITLCGQSFTMKPTLNAGLSISRQAGGIRAAMDRVAAMDLDTVITVIRLGVGPEQSKSVKNFDQLVFENGLTDADGGLLGKCMEYLANLARGGKPLDTSSAEEAEAEDSKTPQMAQS